MMTVDIPPEIARILAETARRLGRTPEALIAEAVTEYLQDIEDGTIAAERLDKPEASVSLEELDRGIRSGAPFGA